MPKEKTALDIINAIEATSTEELRSLARIERKLGVNQGKGNSGPVTEAVNQSLSDANNSEVTVKATRKARPELKTAETIGELASISNLNITDLNGPSVAQEAKDKLTEPYRRKESLRGSNGRFVSQRSLTSEPIKGSASLNSSERVAKFNIATQTSKERHHDFAIDTDSLGKSINALNATVADQTKAIYRKDKNGRYRDKNGRFLSKEKLAELKASKANIVDNDDGKIVKGLLGTIRGLNNLGNGSAGGEGSAIDLAGTAAGGALWQMGRGAFDIAHSTVSSAISLNDWRKDTFGKKTGPDTRGKAEFEEVPQSHGNLAIKPAIKYPDVKPLDPDASKSTFEQGAQHAQVKATEKQTSTLAAKDDLILKNQEDEIDLLKKILHKPANDNTAGSLFSRLFGGKGERGGIFGGRGRKRRRSRNKKKGFISSTRERFSRKNKERVGSDADAEKRKKAPRVETDTSKQKPTGAYSDSKAARTPSSKPDVTHSVDGKPKPTNTHSVKSTPEPMDGKEGSKAKPSEGEGKLKPKFAANDPNINNASRTVGVSEKQAIDILGGKSKTTGAESVIEKTALGAGEKLGSGAIAKTAIKTGGKVAGKTALKMIPVIGTAAGIAWDAADGYSDTEGQQKAFDLKDGQEASDRQKKEMSAASVASLGGLVPMASQGLSWMADKAGLDGVAKALDFDTADMARGIDDGITGVQNLTSSVGTAVAGWFKTDDQNKSNIQNEVKAGADKTVEAINNLTKQLQGGQYGQDGVGASGLSRSDYTAPTTDSIILGENGLNIGGKNAANRSFRNNNFGNLNFAGQENAMLESQPAKGKARFARFATPEDGFRGLANQISSYSNGTSKAAGYQKLTTVKDIISKWAPPSENNTAKYIDTVSANLGVKPTDTIDTSNQQVMIKMIRAIATYEGGNPNVSDKMIGDSIGHEDASSHKWVGGTYSKESQAYMAQKNIKPSRYTNTTATGATVTQPANVKPIEDSDIKASSPAIPSDKVSDQQPAATPIAKAGTTANQSSTSQQEHIPINPESVGATSVAAALSAKAIQAHKVTQAHAGGIGGVVEHGASVPSMPTGKTILKSVAKVGGAALAGGGLASLSQYKDVALSKASDYAGSALSFAKENMPDIQLPPAIIDMMDSVKNGHVMADAAKLSKQGDAKAVAALESFTGRRIGFRRANSDLSMPSGNQAIPAGLRSAMKSPDVIAKESESKFAPQDPVSGVPAPSVAPHRKKPPIIGQLGSDKEGTPIVSGDTLNKAFELDPKTGQPISPPQTAQAKDGGVMSSIGDFFGGVGHSVMGIASGMAPQVLSSLGGVAQGFQGYLGDKVGDLGSMASGVVGGAGSPILSSFADPLINQGISATTDMINNPQQVMSMFSMPREMPAVTDLAKSGVRPDLAPPKDNTDEIKILSQLVDLTRQLVSGQKDKPEARPDVVVNGGQKPPKHDDIHKDSALTALMGD